MDWSMSRARRGSARLGAALLLAAQSAAASDPAPPPDYRAPDTQQICPALAEDYEICSEDLMSGNCADLVTAVGRLGEIYRSELSAHPGWIEALQNTDWWGCGPVDLRGLGQALAKIDTPAARAVLAQEPFRSLGAASAPESAPAPPAPSPTAADCLAPAGDAERDACAASRLATARAAHERDFAACRARVAPALRGELLEAETSWERMLPLECSGAASVRDECLARAYDERTQSLAEMHPECAAEN